MINNEPQLGNQQNNLDQEEQNKKNKDEHHEPQLGDQQDDHNYNKQRKKQQ